MPPAVDALEEDEGEGAADEAAEDAVEEPERAEALSG